MKMDPDVNIIAKQSVAMMSKATVCPEAICDGYALFVDYLAEKLKEKMENEDGKQIKVDGVAEQ